MRRVIAGVIASAVVAGGVISAIAAGASSTGTARSRVTATFICPTGAQVLPAEAVARAADQARIEAPHLYPGRGPAIVNQSDRGPYAGPRGGEVRHQCGSEAFHRTVVVQLFFPKELPSASLSQGTVFVSLSATGYRVWEVAH